MRNRKAEAIKKRIAERKRRMILQNKKWQPDLESIEKNDEPLLEETESSNHSININQNEHNKNNSIQKDLIFTDWFQFRLLVSMFFVLILAIIFRSTNPTYEPVKSFIKGSMKKDYQFTKISNWTSKTMGDMFSYSPFEFFKTENESKQNSEVIPVSGKVIESFKKNGQGITVETERNKNISAIHDGIVIFSGNDQNHGKTVIVQSDHMNVWYGNLGSIKVNLYQHIVSGDTLGTVLNNTTSNHGEYYFAIEKDDKFLNPSKVISFE